MLAFSWFLIFEIFNTEAMQTLTDQPRNGQFSNSAYRHKMQTLSKPVEGLTNKADDLKKSNTKHNVFIDIESPYLYRRMGISKEHHIHLSKSEDSHVQTTRLQLLLQKQIHKSLTVKNSTTLFKSVSSPEFKFRNKLSFRREPMIFAKSLTTSAPQGIKAKVDRKQYVSNRKMKKTNEIKKKVLTHLQELEKDIKLLKTQIENDTQTIKDLQNKIRQKEKQRAELKLINENNSILVKTFSEKPTVKILTKNLDNALIKNVDFKTPATIDNNRNENFENNKYPKVEVQHYIKVKNENDKFNFDKNTLKLQQPTKATRNQLTKEKNSIQNNSLDSHKLNKYRRHNNVTTRGNITEIGEDYLENTSKNINTNKVEENGLYNDYDIGKNKKNGNSLNSVSKGKYDTEYIKMYKNISNEEKVENPTASTPSIFDLHEDLETFERFDGEFDWEKFVTSEMYIQIAKNSTAENADFRRMLTDKNGTTPTFVSDPPEPVTSFADKLWFEYFLEPPVTDTREEIVFPPYDLNNTKTSLVPHPGYRKYIPGGLEIRGIPDIQPLNIVRSQESELNYYTDNNVRFDYLNNRRMFPDDQYPIIDGRRNMFTLPTVQTTLDQLSYDSILRDIDRDIEI